MYEVNRQSISTDYEFSLKEMELLESARLLPLMMLLLLSTLIQSLQGA